MKEDWKYKKLGEIATYVNGFAFKPNQWGEVGLPIVRIQNLNKETAPYNYYAGTVDDRYVIHRGDILVSWSASIGIYEWKRGKALLNQHIFKVVFDKKKINKFFFKYAVASKLEEMVRFAHGATMKHIKKSYFNTIEIPFPPLSAQQAIVKELDLLNTIIEKKRMQLEDLDKLGQSIFYDMFGDPVENTKEWQVEKLEKLGILARGVSTHRPRNAPELLGGTMPLIQTSDVANAGMYLKTYNSTYSALGIAQSRVWEKGTLCITVAANIGKCAILTFKACFPDSVAGFISNDQLCNNVYMYFIFSCLQKILEEEAPAVGQKNINLKKLGSLKIPVPPLSLQQQFASRILEIEKIKDKVAVSMTETQELLAATEDKYFG